MNGPRLEMLDITKPLNTRKVNIGSKDEPKFCKNKRLLG